MCFTQIDYLLPKYIHYEKSNFTLKTEGSFLHSHPFDFT